MPGFVQAQPAAEVATAAEEPRGVMDNQSIQELGAWLEAFMRGDTAPAAEAAPESLSGVEKDVFSYMTAKREGNEK